MPHPSSFAGRNWYSQRHGEFMISADNKLLQRDVINSAFDTEMLWWARTLPPDQMTLMLDHCFCLGVYKLGAKGADGTQHRTMVGFGRMITDYVTFGYLTDVFVLGEYQGKGLGRWMLECLNEVLEEWPELRRLILLSSNPHAMKLYADVLGTEDMKSDATPLSVLAKKGPAAPDLTVVHH